MPFLLAHKASDTLKMLPRNICPHFTEGPIVTWANRTTLKMRYRMPSPSAYKHLDQFKATAKMAIWLTTITSALIGARNVEQLDNSLDALKKLEFSTAELAEINRYAQDSGIDLWKDARESAA